MVSPLGSCYEQSAMELPLKPFSGKLSSNMGGLKRLPLIRVSQKKCAADLFNEDLEQDHRFIKKRTRIMPSFKSFYSASKTLSGIENIRIIQKGQIKGQKANQAAFENFVKLMA